MSDRDTTGEREHIVTVAHEYDAPSQYEALGYVYAHVAEIDGFLRAEVEPPTYDGETHEVRATFSVTAPTPEAAWRKVWSWYRTWSDDPGRVAVDGDWTLGWTLAERRTTPAQETVLAPIRCPECLGPMDFEDSGLTEDERPTPTVTEGGDDRG